MHGEDAEVRKRRPHIFELIFVCWTSSGTIIASGMVEDLAGNNFARIFDDDITAQAPVTAPETQRDFTPLDRKSD